MEGRATRAMVTTAAPITPTMAARTVEATTVATANPRDPAQPLVGHVKNLLYDPRFFQHGGHEDEKGDGGEEVLGHVVPDPLGHQGQGVGAPEPGDEDHGKPPDQKGQG